MLFLSGSMVYLVAIIRSCAGAQYYFQFFPCSPQIKRQRGLCCFFPLKLIIQSHDGYDLGVAQGPREIRAFIRHVGVGDKACPDHGLKVYRAEAIGYSGPADALKLWGNIIN